MESTDVTRRAFLATTAGTAATLALAALPSAVVRAEETQTRPEPSGVLYGHAGSRGISGGAAESPSKGVVLLEDGRAIEVAHTSSRSIEAGGSVLLAANDSGGWSILYAQYLG